jgi:uncharacterized protein YecT (DUF1311 family)
MRQTPTPFTIVACCNMREPKIWDERLNDWYGQAQSQLKDDAATGAALKDAQCAWIQFRDAKCDYWEKRYEGGTFASVATGNCTRIETGRRAPRCAPSSTISIISRDVHSKRP